MLLNISYCFIVGAGAGIPYKFPLGTTLYNNIKSNYHKHCKDYYLSCKSFGHLNPNDKVNNAKAFTDQLYLTTGISIDKYININNCFREHGINAIASSIIDFERKSELPNYTGQLENDWYTYLFKKLIEGLNSKDDILRIGENKISFVTFNYDRSLEHFLFENLYGLVKNAGVSRESVHNALKAIQIIHVYGQIGHLPWQLGNYDKYFHNEDKTIVEYGEDRLPMEVADQISHMLSIMYTERKTSEELINARNLIAEADRILFLGFGYDDDNLNILGLPQGLKTKRVYGTSYKSTRNELLHIKSKLSFKDVQDKSEIYDFDSLMLLREHLV